jgi:hypothetical protein
VLQIILSFLVAIRVFFRSRSDPSLEVLAPPTKQGRRAETETTGARIEPVGQILLDDTPPVLVPLVKPETVIGWHRTGFRLYWRWGSRLLITTDVGVGGLTETTTVAKISRQNQSPTWSVTTFSTR